MSVSAASATAERLLGPLCSALNSNDAPALASLFVVEAPAEQYAADLLTAAQTYGAPPDTISIQGVRHTPNPHDPFSDAERQRLFMATTTFWPTEEGVGADLALYLLYDPDTGSYGLRRAYYRWRRS